MQPCDQGYKSSDVDPELPLPTPVDPAFVALELMEVLRAVLEGQRNEEKQGALSKRMSTDTTNVILKWLQRDEVSKFSLIVAIFAHIKQI